MEGEGVFLKSFYEANITMLPEAEKYISQEENYIPISLMNTDAKIPLKLANRIQQYIRRMPHASGFYL